MSIFTLGERYHHGNGFLHRADARAKIIVAVAFAFGITTVPAGHWTAFLGFAVVVALALAVSTLPPRLVVQRSLLAIPFVAAAVPLIFTRAGETLFTVPVLGWTASRAGMVAVGSILLKSWLAVLVAVILTSCTPALDLIRGVERLRLPRIMASTIFFMYRYLFVIGEEGHRLMRAREARSAAVLGYRSGGSLRWRAGVLGAMIGSLFIRSFERSERIFAAMQARGYDGSMRALHTQRIRMTDWVLLLASLLVLGGLVTYARF